MQLDPEEIRKNIKSEIAKTEERLDGYRDMAKPVGPDNAIGRVSRMDAIVNSSVAGAALREAERKLSNLRAMLGKVDEPDFGLCSRCKKPIPFKRLMLMPQSSLCVHCAK
ncbi:MAG: TraR/DksA family transcriptional regulator [Saprospiraceae bacterium]